MLRKVRQIRERQRRIAAPGGKRATKPSRLVGAGGGGGRRWGVLRSVDVEGGKMLAQYIRNRYSPPVEGQDEAFGAEFQVYPAPGRRIEDYDVGGVVTPLVGEPANEQLGVTYIPVRIDPQKQIEIMTPLPRGVKTMKDQGQGGEGSGV